MTTLQAVPIVIMTVLVTEFTKDVIYPFLKKHFTKKVLFIVKTEDNKK